MVDRGNSSHEETIAALQSNSNHENNTKCKTKFSIYKDKKHIKVRVGNDKILGSRAEFCGAFYHVYHDRHDKSDKKRYACLEKLPAELCAIAESGRGGSEKTGKWAQPKTAVAVVKCENKKRKIVYQARYTNCYKGEMHVEDYFKMDVEGNGEGGLKAKIGEVKKITLYITMQPCHYSVIRTGGTPEKKSCCETLVELYKELKGKRIRMCVKPTHIYKAHWENEENGVDIKNAKDGIKWLLREGIQVAPMEKGDWNFLWKMVDDADDREKMDDAIAEFLYEMEEEA